MDYKYETGTVVYISKKTSRFYSRRGIITRLVRAFAQPAYEVTLINGDTITFWEKHLTKLEKLTQQLLKVMDK